MKLSFRIKHFIFSAFRELFVHNHGSLEFRAKIFALVIAANEDSTVDSYLKVKKIGQDIYNDDMERIDLLILSTKELVQKVKDDNGLDIDTLIANIQKDLKYVPRYAKKIDVEALKSIVDLSFDEDTIAYQNRILEFLEKLKNETLHTKKSQIEKDERDLNSKY